jgi:hypothetical protein
VLTVRSKWLPSSYFLNFIYGKISGGEERAADYKFIIITIIFISFMQGIYTYIPETNNVPREYTVAAILLLWIMVPIFLVPISYYYFYYLFLLLSSSLSPLCRVFIHIFLKQTMSLGNTLFQLFSCYCLWCLYL